MSGLWTLCFPGWTTVGLSEGALALIARHLPQMRGLDL